LPLLLQPWRWSHPWIAVLSDIRRNAVN